MTTKGNKQKGVIIIVEYNNNFLISILVKKSIYEIIDMKLANDWNMAIFPNKFGLNFNSLVI